MPTVSTVATRTLAMNAIKGAIDGGAMIIKNASGQPLVTLKTGTTSVNTSTGVITIPSDTPQVGAKGPTDRVATSMELYSTETVNSANLRLTFVVAVSDPGDGDFVQLAEGDPATASVLDTNQYQVDTGSPITMTFAA